CQPGGEPSEIALPLLHLHRARLVMVDEPALALGGAREEHLGDDLAERRRVGFDRRGERIAAEGAEADAAHFRLLAGEERDALVVGHYPLRRAGSHTTTS